MLDFKYLILSLQVQLYLGLSKFQHAQLRQDLTDGGTIVPHILIPFVPFLLGESRFRVCGTIGTKKVYNVSFGVQFMNEAKKHRKKGRFQLQGQFQWAVQGLQLPLSGQRTGMVLQARSTVPFWIFDLRRN